MRKKEQAWVHDKYRRSHIFFKVECDVWFRIARHRDQLIRELKREIKKISIANGNAKVIDVDIEWQEELIVER